MDTTSKGIRVLIVDDHQMFIDGVKILLRRVNNIDVVADALNGEDALEIMKNQDIDLLITDISMGEGMSGTELTRIVKTQYPDIKVIVLTMYNDSEIIKDIMLSEAEGYILKNTGKEELVKAITTIADHGTYYSNEVLVEVMSGMKKANKVEENVADITPREKEIIEMICLEKTASEIADKLFIARSTVDTHRKNIYRKLEINTSIGLIRFAIENRLIKVDVLK